MPCRFSRRNDPLRALITSRRDNEQDAVSGHADHKRSFLAVVETIIQGFQAIGVLKGDDRIDEADPMFAEIGGRFFGIPLVTHGLILPDTGSVGKAAIGAADGRFSESPALRRPRPLLDCVTRIRPAALW
jgi:hypothetical protein